MALGLEHTFTRLSAREIAVRSMALLLVYDLSAVHRVHGNRDELVAAWTVTSQGAEEMGRRHGDAIRAATARLRHFGQ